LLNIFPTPVCSKPIRSKDIWLLKSISTRNYSFRSCVITLRLMIRVRCV
jgi:hypothetical protein